MVLEQVPVFLNLFRFEKRGFVAFFGCLFGVPSFVFIEIEWI